MADEVQAPTPVATAAATPKTADPKTEVPETPKFVPIEEHQKVLDRLNGISGVLNELKAQIKKPAEPPKPRELPEVAKQVEELQTQTQQLLADKTALENEQLLDQMTRMFRESGVPDAHAEMLAENWKAQRKFKKVGKSFVQVDKTDAGENETPLADVIKVFLATDKGQTFVAPKRAPVSEMGKGSPLPTGVTRTSADLRTGNYNLEDLVKGKVQIQG